MVWASPSQSCILTNGSEVCSCKSTISVETECWQFMLAFKQFKSLACLFRKLRLVSAVRSWECFRQMGDLWWCICLCSGSGMCFSLLYVIMSWKPFLDGLKTKPKVVSGLLILIGSRIPPPYLPNPIPRSHCLFIRYKPIINSVSESFGSRKTPPSSIYLLIPTQRNDLEVESIHWVGGWGAPEYLF